MERVEGQEFFRRVLCRQLDALIAQFELWVPALGEVSIEVLRAPVVSTWGSIFGILDHSITDQGITCSILEERGHGGDEMADYAGNSRDLAELAANQRAVDRRFAQVIAECADFTATRYFFFPDRGHWHRARFYELAVAQIEHTHQHRGQVDQLLRERGVKLPVNPLYELVMSGGNDFPTLEAALAHACENPP
jgi:uncharacterized damage-inducible protein DinB